MKEKISLSIILALVILTDASSWEGAAATAPNGELPATGRYVATNSFPRNTVVDITNIETNKSTRAIVANSLNSPGLLAVISREAAEIIGMRPGSIGRVRITQPSDPIAYLRFTEGLASGIPDYDSGNVITEETYQDKGLTFSPEKQAPASAGETPPQISANTVPGYVLEPEWGGINRRNIIDLPEFILPAESPYSAFPDKPDTGVAQFTEDDKEQIAETVPEEEDGVTEQIAETAGEETDETAEEIAGTSGEETDEAVEEIAGTSSEEPDEAVEEVAETTGEETDETAEQIAETAGEETDETAEQVAWSAEDETGDVTEQIESASEIAEVVEYNLVPSNERPPKADIYGIDPSDIIPGISRASSKVEPVKAEPVKEEPVKESAVAVTEPRFSASRVYQLDRGWYYVQIAALDTAESAENAVNMIDSSYKPIVYKDGDNWYRVLLGPLNQGESAAVLQRFRSIGYKDAFVRQVR